MITYPITINVSLTEDDLLDFYTHNARRGLLMKFVILFAILIFLGQLIRIIFEPEALQEGAWKWLLAVVGLFFLMYFLNKSNAHKEFKRNKRLQVNHVYIVNKDSIHIKGGTFNTVFQWEKLHNVTESKKCFFIWLNKQSVQIVPKKNMNSEEIAELSTLRKNYFKK